MKSVAAFQKLTGFELACRAETHIQRLMAELREHDLGTYEHCGRVSQLCFELARDLELDVHGQALAGFAGLLHDVGKLKVQPEIINKPSKLTSEEFQIMKRHTTFGVELLKPLEDLPFFKMICEAVLYHHERIDGNGYHGLSSEQIPFTSKIILVADTVDAMGADRAYRKGLPLNVIIDELIRCSGTQFDSQIVNVFLESLSRQQKVAA